MLGENQEKTIDFLIQLESEMSELYKIFAQRFPQDRATWENMSREETQHAEHYKTLASRARDGVVTFNEKQTNLSILQLFLDKIKEVQKKTESGELSPLNALSLALDFEQSIIEKKFYEFFTTRDPNIRTFLKNIEQETVKHAAGIRTIWFLEKRKQEGK